MLDQNHLLIYTFFVGLIYDLTLSWELSFYLAGGWIIVAGVFIAFIQPVRNYQQKRLIAEECESSMA